MNDNKLKYLKAAEVLIYSLKHYGRLTGVDYVCITPDSQSYITKCQKIFDKVIQVSYISAPVNVNMWKRFKDHYQGWLDKCFTKLHVFNLTQYDKVLFLDADMLCINSLKEIFSFKTPAGVFMLSNDKGIRSGIKTNNQFVHNSMLKGFGVGAGCFLITPSQTDFINLCSLLTKSHQYIVEQLSLDKSTMKQISKRNDKQNYFFVDKRYYAGPDEQLITCYLQLKYKWTSLSKQYNCVPWKQDEINQFIGPVKILHYIVTKPWEKGADQWDDVKQWKQVYKELKETKKQTDKKTKEAKRSPKRTQGAHGRPKRFKKPKNK